MSTNPTSPKVIAGAGGAGAGTLLGIVLVWILTANGVEVPELVASAIGGLLALGISAGSAYLKRDPMREDYVTDHYEPRHDA